MTTLYILLGTAAVFSVVFPAALLIVWRKKTGAKLMPALFGAICFVLFALVLETIPKYPLFVLENSVSSYILSHTWAYTLAGTLLAGVFEETGRFVLFSLMKKKYHDRTDSVMFGIGHGGIECALIFGMMMIEFLAFSVMIQNGTFDTLFEQLPANVPNAEAQIAALKEQVQGLTAGYILLCMWERVVAVTAQIALSVLVFVSVHNPKKRYLYPLATLLHMLFDVAPALYQRGVISLAVCEIIIFVMAAAFVPAAVRVYRNAASLPQ